MKINIIGIGKIGCNITSWFKIYPQQYQTYFIDTVKYANKSLLLPQCDTFVEYEQRCPDFQQDLKKIKGKTYVILSGANKTVGATLRILSCLSQEKCNITIVYIQTENENNLIYGVLQEYTRSGMFDNLIFFSNKNIEKILNGIPISNYYETINNQVANLIDNLNYFTFNKPIFSHQEKPLLGARISTLSVVDLDNQFESPFFNLDTVRERRYSFGVSKEILETDKNYLNKIKEYINFVNPNKDIKIGYSIYQMEGGKDIAICMLKSPEIQMLGR